MERLRGFIALCRRSKNVVMGYLCSGIGVGLAVHDFILECQKISNPYRLPPHGFWCGILLVLIGIVIRERLWR